MIELLRNLIVQHPSFACGLAFVLGFLTDWVWATWARSIKDDKPFSAANFSVLIYLFGICYTLLIIESQIGPLLLYLVGGWIGTFISVFTSTNNIKS